MTRLLIPAFTEEGLLYRENESLHVVHAGSQFMKQGRGMAIPIISFDATPEFFGGVRRGGIRHYPQKRWQLFEKRWHCSSAFSVVRSG
jgi:hypothetical protein